MDSHHENEINFGHEEANRMHATHRDWTVEAERWLRTTTGQEFCDELVWGTIEQNTLNALLRSFGANVNEQNRQRFINLTNSLLTRGEI